MRFDPPLVAARLERRYKRFLADVTLADGSTLTVHCPNTGAMTGCAEPGSRVWLLPSDNPRRKYRYTWELVENDAGDRIGIHSARANRLVEQALRDGRIASLAGFTRLTREARYGAENSRIDLLAEYGEMLCFIEVKCVTLGDADGLGRFPDTVSERASRHLRELMAVRAQGHRAVLFFCVQHTGVTRVAPADTIDPVYGRTLREAAAAGVEIHAWRAAITPEAMSLERALPVDLGTD